MSVDPNRVAQIRETVETMTLDRRTADPDDNSLEMAILRRVNQIFQALDTGPMTTIEILAKLQTQMTALEGQATALGVKVDNAVADLVDAAAGFAQMKAELDAILAAVAQPVPQIVGLDVKFGQPTPQSKVVTLKPEAEVKK